MNKYITALLVAALLLPGVWLKAQNSTSIPLNPEVKHGKLSNGMTYYIMKNQEPKERASIYFVQNVGAILEEDSQNGLAHFLEHMAFNGLEHYPGKSMLKYLEANGVKFGRDINAYTSQDETVYNLSNIPTIREGLLDSALLVLHDWSGGLLLEGDEIEAERGVIREEWRTRRNSGFRLMKQTMPYVYNNSKYAERDVIGSLDIINNFDHQELRDYYDKWYRPDLQAVVVVGDVDTEKVEQKVKTLFSKIPAKENPAERVYYPIEDSEEMGFVVAKDKEAQGVGINWIFRNNPVAEHNEAYMRTGMAQRMFRMMMSNRLSELTRKPDCPALSMGVGHFTLARTKDAAYLSINPKENKEKEAFALMVTELERARRFGFNESELERTKTELLRSYETYYEDREKIKNDTWAKQLGDHFLKASPLPSIEWELEFAKKTIPAITLNEVHALFGDFGNVPNSVITISGPDKDEITYPTKDELMAAVETVLMTKLEPYHDDADDSPLVAQELTEKAVIEEKPVDGTDAMMYKLENGAQVVILPTELSKDEILFSAHSFGGMSLLEEDELATGNLVTNIAAMSGAGTFDATQLKKKLSGKIANVSATLGDVSEGFRGSASPKDFETMLQLLYLKFQEPRFEKDSYETLVGSLKNRLVYIKTDNNRAFSDTISVLRTNYNPRNLLFNEDFVNQLDYDKAVAIYKDRFQDASDFTFIFVGNIELERDMPLIKKYIGNLSASERTETWVNHKIKPAPGASARVIEREMEVPKSTVYYSLYNDVEYNLKTRTYVRVIADLLSKRYLETIREEEGGSYGVSVRPSISKRPYERASIAMSFDTDPEKRERLSEIMKQEIVKLAKNGPILNDLNEIKKNYLKNREEAEDQNSFWLSVIRGSLINDEPVVSTEDYNKMINDISAKEVKKFARKLFKNYDSIEVVMNPAQVE
ncbi:zinc protease [Saccharicrinis carchari]|uniref:Zinc protease n=1 Tax=Saccharicrinis carchari TaxID=1168039 RepID=A0A521CP48_SACCC|nr:M16 family metallopeptidase [Saccharicrinis carchari]SMO61206.1 zinc protease [Saccharicrinis carchari]